MLDSRHGIHVQIMTKLILFLLHEICMHTTIYIIGLLTIGILYPSHVLESMMDDSFGHHCQ